MTAFERATVAAFWARLHHGEASTEYTQALLEMEAARPYRSSAGACGRCGRLGHRSSTCANLEHPEAA